MNSGKLALEVYQKLSSQQKRFLNEKDLTDSKTLQEWLDFLEGPVEYDVLIDKTTQSLKMAIRLLWFFAGFNLIVAIITQSWHLAVLGVAMGALALYQRVKRGSYFKRDLHNHLRLFFYPALKGLSEKLEAATPIKAQFWLREKDQNKLIMLFSLNLNDRKIDVAVGPNSYELTTKIEGEAQTKTGENLHHSNFVETLLHFGSIKHS